MASPRPHRSFGKRRWALTLAVLLLVFVEPVSPAPLDDAPADSDDAPAEEDAGAETREITDDTAGAGAGTAVAPRMQAARSRSRAWACGATVKASVLELRRRVDAAGRGARTQIFGEGWVIRPKSAILRGAAQRRPDKAWWHERDIGVWLPDADIEYRGVRSLWLPIQSDEPRFGQAPAGGGTKTCSLSQWSRRG